MKSPHDLRSALRRQWDDADRRETRLLGHQDAWPISLSIGRPSPTFMKSNLDAVKRHVDAWRRERVGCVIWEPIRYRATEDAVELPVRWEIQKPSQWLQSCGDNLMRQEFEMLSDLIANTDAQFHRLLIRCRALWRDKQASEVIRATRLAMKLSPGCAGGRPLRTLSTEGIDTKFFERHGGLVTTLMDLRYDGEVSHLGLATFLGALVESENWLLVIDLDGSLLPFQRQRVRSGELRRCKFPGDRLLIVENECCGHLLPSAAGTLAILGAGFDLNWIQNSILLEKQVAYWGDIDTWGLQFLATTRQTLPHVTPLMMTMEVYDQHHDSAVAETVHASEEPPEDLCPAERSLYRQLLKNSKGRLEQEFLAETLVRKIVEAWTNGSCS